VGYHHAMRCAVFALSILLVPVMAQDLATGEAIFNVNCAFCHGTDGSGGRGPNLRGSLRSGNLDADIAKVISNGIPGTAMPKFGLEDDELKSIVMYVQSFRKAAPAVVPVEGDPLAGKRIYEAQGCSRCHEIGNQGSALGPNLSRAGVARSYEYLKTSIVDPSVDIPAEYEPIRIVTQAGKRVQGVWVNEDSFTIQIRLPDESFASFDKQTLKEVAHEKKSTMPAYRLGETDLKNLLAYLSSLTGNTNTTETQKEERAR
jgi:putative heme-binding domain-containing protein